MAAGSFRWFGAGSLFKTASGSGTSSDPYVLSVASDSSGSASSVYDAGPASTWLTSLGVAGARYTSADRSASAASVTDAPTSTQKLVITDCIISVDTAMRVDLKEETSGTVFFSVYLPANGSYSVVTRGKFKLATADKKLQVQTSAAGNIAVTCLYYSEA